MAYNYRVMYSGSSKCVLRGSVFVWYKGVCVCKYVCLSAK